MNFKSVILAYFIIGATMTGGGVVAMDDAGLTQWFIDTSGDQVGVEDQATNKLEGVGGAIKSVVDAFGGPLILVWNTVVGFLGYMHWPVVVLAGHNAPPSVTILLGGGFVVAFYVAVIGLVMSS